MIKIFEKEFEGWESLQDWDREMSELWDERFNPDVKGLPGEFTGKIKVVITYEGDDLKAP